MEKKEEKQYDLRNLENFFKFVYYHIMSKIFNLITKENIWDRELFRNLKVCAI